MKWGLPDVAPKQRARCSLENELHNLAQPRAGCTLLTQDPPHLRACSAPSIPCQGLLGLSTRPLCCSARSAGGGPTSAAAVTAPDGAQGARL